MKIGPVFFEAVGFFWTIGIFGPIAAFFFWMSRLESKDWRMLRWMLSFAVALAIAPTLVPGIGSEIFNHVLPASIAVFLGVIGFGNWEILLCGAVPLVLFTWLFAAVGKRLARKRFGNG